MLSPYSTSRTAVVDTSAVTRPFESPHPLRPARLALLDAASTRGGWRDVALRPNAAASVGHARYAQVWQAEAEVDGRKSGRVVVKLFAEALWPLPHDWINVWRPLEQRVESELRAYASLRPRQGRDVPHCYGAYEFEMPWGDKVVGVVLEDLGEVGETLAEFSEREKDGVLAEIESAYETISASFHCLHRLQVLDIGQIRPDAGNVYVLRSSTASEPHIVFAGFSWAGSAAEGRRRAAARDPDLVYRWRDEGLLENTWWLSIDYRLEWVEEVERREPGLVAWGGVRVPGLVEDLSEERARVFC